MPSRQPKVIDPPDHLDAAARAEWAKMFPQLAAARKTTEADMSLLAGYCQSYSRWQQAESELAKTGPVVRSPQGGAMQSPWHSISRAALRDMTKCLEALGLTAAKRAKTARNEEDGGVELSILDVVG